MAAEDPTMPPTPSPPPEWLAPASLSYSGAHQGQYGGYPPPAPPPAMFELRPLTLSEVLDRTFALYRTHFWLFAGIAVFSGAFQALVGASQLLTQGHMMRQFPPIGQTGPRPIYVPTSGDFIGPLLTLVGSLLFFLAYSITTAATVWAVSEIYLNRPASVKGAFGATLGRWYRYIAVALWQACSFAWPIFALVVPGFLMIFTRNTTMTVIGGILMIVGVLGGFVLGYILYLRNMLAVPACVAERLPVRPSMRRSKILAAGSKGRIFVVQLVMVVLYMVVGMVQAPFSIAAVFSMAKLHGAVPYALQAIAVIVGFLGHTVVTPVLAIGLTLLYFDARVRKEAFDIAVLMGEEHPGVFAVPPAPVYPAYAAPVEQAYPYAPPAPASFAGVAEPLHPVVPERPHPEQPGDSQAGV